MTESDKPAPQPSAPPPPPYPYGPYPGGYPPPPQPYAGYPPPPQPYAGYAPPPISPKNGLGIGSLVIAIIGLLFVWSVVLGIIAGLVAVILGFVGWGRAKRGEATNGGVAIAGIVLGFLAIVISLIFVAIWIGVFNRVGGGDYLDCLSEAGSDERAIQQCADQFQDRLQRELNITVEPTAPGP
jgi:Domain of unknown function (DUF4190)